MKVSKQNEYNFMKLIHDSPNIDDQGSIMWVCTSVYEYMIRKLLCHASNSREVCSVQEAPLCKSFCTVMARGAARAIMDQPLAADQGNARNTQIINWWLVTDGLLRCSKYSRTCILTVRIVSWCVCVCVLRLNVCHWFRANGIRRSREVIWFCPALHSCRGTLSCGCSCMK